jgi:aspartyl-tRNA(Asn)/glutamyl-tRNA(Gln) amidotransferase subunit B
MRSPEEAAAYLRELRATLEALDVSDVKMEEGSLRCDANVSLRPSGAAELGTKVEIKNMNSIRSLERALHYEVERQARALDAGEPLIQETRHWDEDAGITTSMRSKEEAFDYRYFPEPDIPPMEPADAWVEDIRVALPELPRARRGRYVGLGLRPETARVLVGDRRSVALFDGTLALYPALEPKSVANWITQDVAALRNAAGDEGVLTPTHVGDLVSLLDDDTISGAGAKQALEVAFGSGEPIRDIVERLGLLQVSDAGALGALADEVIDENPEVAQKVRSGKEGAIGFLLGQLMKKAGGSANPKLAQEILRERLQG